MPIGTPLHERTLALCESLNYREWSGYYAVSAYEGHHEHEYNAIRNASALIDVSPLFKYIVSGRDAAKFVDRIITRDVFKMAIGQVYLHAVVRRTRQGDRRWYGDAPRGAAFRWTAADPSLRWFSQNAIGTGRRHRGYLRERGGARPSGAHFGDAAASTPKPILIGLKYFRMTQRHDRRRSRRYFANGIYRRSGIRNLDAIGRRGARVGSADAGRANRSISNRRACSRSTSRGSKRGCCSSRSIFQQQEGADPSAGLLTV